MKKDYFEYDFSNVTSLLETTKKISKGSGFS